MRLHELADLLTLTELTPTTGDADPNITKGYASDLLSDVLANAPSGGVLVTLQVHLNVIAVAGHAGLAAVIFSSGRRPEEDVVAKAAEEGIALFTSPDDTFDLVGRLYALGIEGGGA
jgi:hypothetical protein